MQARVNIKMCLPMFRVHTNSSPSYVSSLVTSFSSLQTRQSVGLRSSSQADFVAHNRLEKYGNRAFALAAPGCIEQASGLHSKICIIVALNTNLKTYVG